MKYLLQLITFAMLLPIFKTQIMSQTSNNYCLVPLFFLLLCMVSDIIFFISVISPLILFFLQSFLLPRRDYFIKVGADSPTAMSVKFLDMRRICRKEEGEGLNEQTDLGNISPEPPEATL